MQGTVPTKTRYRHTSTRGFFFLTKKQDGVAFLQTNMFVCSSS